MVSLAGSPLGEGVSRGQGPTLLQTLLLGKVCPKEGTRVRVLGVYRDTACKIYAGSAPSKQTSISASQTG